MFFINIIFILHPPTAVFYLFLGLKYSIFNFFECYLAFSNKLRYIKISRILEQYKKYRPNDPMIAEKFNTYRFADYKEKVIDLPKHGCTVSIKTMEIIKQMI